MTNSGRGASLALVLWLTILTVLASASPTERPNPVAAAEPDPLITPSPSLNRPTRTMKRDLLHDIENGVHSVLTELGSAIPSYVASGECRLSFHFGIKEGAI